MLINDYISAAAGGSSGAVPLFWWQGWSGRWYLSSVLDLNRFECREPGLFVLVRREATGERTPLLIGKAQSVSDDLYALHADACLRAVKAGANEIHVSLAADDEVQRDVAVSDIAAGWGLPVLYPAEGV